MARTRQAARKSTGGEPTGGKQTARKSTGRKSQKQAARQSTGRMPLKKNTSSNSERPASPSSSTGHVSDFETATVEEDGDSETAIVKDGGDSDGDSETAMIEDDGDSDGDAETAIVEDDGDSDGDSETAMMEDDGDSETDIVEDDSDSDGSDDAEPASDPVSDAKRDGDEDGICIDLGSTYTCGKRGTENLDLKHGQPTYRSAVQLSADGAMGLPSPSAASGRWIAVLEHWKRLIGRSPDDPGLEDDVASVPHAALGENGAVYRFGDQEIAPEEVAGFLLGKYRQRAEASYGKKAVKRLVLTVPAYFSHRQKEAMHDVARIAGFDAASVEITTMPEPVAASLWRVERDANPASLVGKRMLVLDIGGGTTDACALRVWPCKDGRPRSYVVESTAGDNRLGGLDFDQALLGLALRKAGGRVDFEVDTGELLRQCKHEKEQLTDQESVTITISALDPTTKPETVDVSDAEFREACRPLFDRIAQILRDVVAGRFEVKDVHAVYLVGGSSSLPGLRGLVQSAFPASTTELFPDGGQVVAAGGGLHAMDPRDVMDVLPRAIGIRAHHCGADQYETILPRNLQLPASRTRTFYTQEANQREVAIDMLEGGHVALGRNLALGGFVVAIPACAAGTEVAVGMRVAQAGRIEATARIAAVAQSLTVTMQPRLDGATLARYARATACRLAGGKVRGCGGGGEGAGTGDAAAGAADDPTDGTPADAAAKDTASGKRSWALGAAGWLGM